MIIRILHEGQYEVSDEVVATLNDLDGQLLTALDENRDDEFRRLLTEMLEHVRKGVLCADDFLGSSDSVLPAADSAIEDVRAMLASDGLVPG